MDKFKKIWIVILLITIPFIGGMIVGDRMDRAVSTNLPANQEKESQRELPRMDELNKLIEENYLFDVDEKKVEESVYKGLFEGLGDPYSVYLNEEEYQSLMESTSGKYAGVGIVVSVSEDNFITVVSPIEGTPAAEAGIRTGDKIVQVDETSYTGKQMDDAVDKMRGEPNTDVILTISRPVKDKADEVFDVTLTRRIIQTHTVKSQILNGNIGYITINQFDENTYKEFSSEYEKVKSEGATGIILDLRNNPGGVLPITVQIADMLLPEGPIVKTVDKKGNEQIESSEASMEDQPMTVLVNQGSASASEILAGALKDYGRAVIIGETTFGKGIVQRIFPLSENVETGPGVKLTISEYYTPKGTKIHGVGVEPDIKIELDKEITELGPDHLDQDEQLQEAITNITERIR
ncbi:S41 family peptidase [Gallicola sp. Sow4_E12]|uniref:S41 family peptidase n=1 Tax=Gallicola sp. Sow4_E12 TaxID=3438785 RepID=UPI003F9026EF